MGAGRIRRENISAGRICPGAASTADHAEFAYTASSLIAVRIPEFLENIRFHIDFPEIEIFLSEIPAGNVQKTAGLHYPTVRNENESAAGKTTALRC